MTTRRQISIERRQVSLYLWERPKGTQYARTEVLIFPEPPKVKEIMFLCTLTTSSEKARAWRLELAQVIGQVPVELPAVVGGRVLLQIRNSLRIVLMADMLDAGMLEYKYLMPFGVQIIDLLSVKDFASTLLVSG